MENANDQVYWRIYWPVNETEPCVVCMQWFDEPDYSQERFVTDQKFTTEEDAETALRLFFFYEPPKGDDTMRY